LFAVFVAGAKPQGKGSKAQGRFSGAEDLNHGKHGKSTESNGLPSVLFPCFPWFLFLSASRMLAA
jgi:hypothetical protein